MKQILLCTDGSNYSEVCTHYAAWMSKRLDWGITAVDFRGIAKNPGVTIE